MCACVSFLGYFSDPQNINNGSKSGILKGVHSGTKFYGQFSVLDHQHFLKRANGDPEMFQFAEFTQTKTYKSILELSATKKEFCLIGYESLCINPNVWVEVKKLLGIDQEIQF